MRFDLTFRTILSLAIVAVAAILVALLSNGVAAPLIAVAFGAVAVFAAAGVDSDEDADGDGDEPAPPTPAQRAGDPAIAIDALIDAIVEPVLLIGEGRVVRANRAARALLGAHMLGEDVRTAIRHPAAAERLTSEVAHANAAPIELVGLGTLDQRWQMRVTDIDGNMRVVHLIDQTGNYATERMRVDFVANASHELRTPLASILGYVETLGDAAGDDPTTRARFLKVVLDEARRMQRLVEDLMSLSRIEAEKYRLPATPIDLAGLIDEVRSELADSHGERGRDVVAEIASGLPSVAGDRAQLSQMLHNLIGNAMKYGRPATPIRVRLSSEGTRMVRLSVADEGEGIAAEHVPRLTERFYRTDPSRSRAMGGTGLGLAIVKHIVERHRGRLDIASTPGVGTRFSVSLPTVAVLGQVDVIKP